MNQFKKHFGSRRRVQIISAIPCIICNTSPSENAHVISKAAGGTWKDVVPMCHRHHLEQHQTGIKTFQEKYKINLIEISKKYAIIVP